MSSPKKTTGMYKYKHSPPTWVIPQIEKWAKDERFHPLKGCTTFGAYNVLLGSHKAPILPKNKDEYQWYSYTDPQGRSKWLAVHEHKEDIVAVWATDRNDCEPDEAVMWVNSEYCSPTIKAAASKLVKQATSKAQNKSNSSNYSGTPRITCRPSYAVFQQGMRRRFPKVTFYRWRRPKSSQRRLRCPTR